MLLNLCGLDIDAVAPLRLALHRHKEPTRDRCAQSERARNSTVLSQQTRRRAGGG
jgi:hypothetical protein